MSKNRTLFFLFFFFIFFLLHSDFALAALEINYPPMLIPGYGWISPSSDCRINCLEIYVAYWFGLLVYLVGALSLISFTMGAVGLISSADSPDRASNAKDRIRGSILGLVLTLASFIILNTIQPTMTTITLAPLPQGPGVFYTNGRDFAPVNQAVSDVSARGRDLITMGFDKIIYKCSETGSGTGPALLIWKYMGKDFDVVPPDIGVEVKRKLCGQEENIADLGSFKWAFEREGVYYFTKLGCQGNMSEVLTNDQDSIGEPFGGHIRSVKIIGDYGVIFHRESGLENGGQCDHPTIGPKTCETVYVDASAVNIFSLNRNPLSSGDGLSFYSAPFEDVKGARSGFYDIAKEEITSSVLFSRDTENMCFKYDGINRPDTYKYKCGDSCSGRPSSNCSYRACASFQDCSGSIKIKGNYLLGLYSEDAVMTPYCQTFKKDVPNLNVQDVFAPGSEKVDYIYIIPTKN